MTISASLEACHPPSIMAATIATNRTPHGSTPPIVVVSVVSGPSCAVHKRVGE
jgi:hypothetical protein